MNTDATKTMIVTLPTATTIEISRGFHAPRSLVWQAYTECQYLSQWWSPEGWSLTVCEMDLREGGSWKYCMSGEMDGKPMDSRGLARYTTVTPQEKLIYTDYFADEHFDPMPDMPAGQIEVRFTGQDGVTLVHSITTYATQQERDTVIEMGMEEGMRQTLDKLAGLLQTLG